MTKNTLVAPVLKWGGGKRQLFETFKPSTNLQSAEIVLTARRYRLEDD